MNKKIDEIIKDIEEHMPEDDNINSMWMSGVKYGMDLAVRYIKQHYDNNDGVDVDTICSFLAELFEAPCNFSSNEKEWVDIINFNEVWCDKNCNNDYTKCWKRLFNQLENMKDDKR